VLKPGAWSVVVLLLMVLGLSAAYELLEWLTAVATGARADAFLGTQGDPWDTQWDMACALIGGSLALLGLRRLHDRQLAALA
jgi:putative membrane protein